MAAVFPPNPPTGRSVKLQEYHYPPVGVVCQWQPENWVRPGWLEIFNWLTGWWFQFLFNVHPYLPSRERDPLFVGWNHQLVEGYIWKYELSSSEIMEIFENSSNFFRFFLGPRLNKKYGNGFVEDFYSCVLLFVCYLRWLCVAIVEKTDCLFSEWIVWKLHFKRCQRPGRAKTMQGRPGTSDDAV